MIRILVIDDEVGMRKAVKAALLTTQADVLEAEDAETGVRMTTAHRPDLVICDFNLGKGSGLEVLDAMRRDRSTALIPLILVTGSDDVTAMRQGMDLGADDFLKKPFSPEQLLAAVKARLRKQEALRTAAEAALQISEARFRAIASAAFDAIIMLGPDSRIHVWNAAAERIFGYPEAEAMGQPLHAMLVSRQGQNAPPRTHPPSPRTGVSPGVGRTLELIARRKDGAQFPVELSLSSVMLDGRRHAVGIVRDVTDRKRAEEEARKAHLRQELHFEQTPMATIEWDVNLRVTRWNPAAQSIFGFSPEEAHQRHASFILQPGVAPTAEQVWQDLLDGRGGPRRTLRNIRRDGVTIVCEWYNTPLVDEGGKVTGAASLVHDITEREQAEQRLHESQTLYSSLVENLPQCVFRKDRAGLFQFVNSRFCAIAGCLPEEIVGRTDADFFPPELAAAYRRDDVSVMTTGQTLEKVEEFPASDGRRRQVQVMKTPLRDAAGLVVGVQGIFWDITGRRQAEERLRVLSRAIEQTPASIVITDPAGRIEYVNPCFERVTGYSSTEAIGLNPRVLNSGYHPAEYYRELWGTITAGREWAGEFENRRKNGELYWEQASISPVRDESGRITHFLAVKQDITDRKRAETQRNALQDQLAQAQKLEAVGRLAAGIAHEINTPIQFVGDNTRFVRDAFADLLGLLTTCEQVVAAAREGSLSADVVAAALEALGKADLEYVAREVPLALDQSLEGVARVARIVCAMKDFSHPGSEEKVTADLNRAIESTLVVCRNEWKYVAKMVTQLDPALPPVPCLLGEFNQVILNLVINSAHAISDVMEAGAKGMGTITVSTRRDGDWAEVRVKDTGGGIPEDIRRRVFDPFFTTKGVGKGTGQGLAIARSVIVDKHGGTLAFESEAGQGTCFIIRLPLTANVPPSAAS